MSVCHVFRSNMPVKKRVIRPVRVYIPRPTRKITGSVTIDGTAETDYVTGFEVTNRVTTGMSQARVKLSNHTKRFSSKYSGGEEIQINADFVDGSAVLFKGRVIMPKPSFDRMPVLEVECNDYSVEVAKRRVTEKYTTATDIGQIAADLISEYAPNFTSTNVNTSTGITATPIWQEKKLWECLKELAVYYGNNGYDFYCDGDKDWHFYAKGTRQVEDYSLVWGQNISRVKMDNTFIEKINRIKVIGKSLNGQTLMATKEDVTDQQKTNSWIMEDVIRDTNLTTISEVKNKASAILTARKNAGRNGTVFTKAGEIAIKAGYQTFISDPYNNLNAWYNISEVKHVLTGNGFTTEVKFYQYVPTDLSFTEVVSRSTKRDQEMMELDNEYGMTQSFPMDFDDSSNIDSDLSDDNVISLNGRLVLGYGTVGKFVSISETAEADVTECVLQVNGANYEACIFSVSAKNGASGTWESVTPNSKHTFTNSGKKLRVRIIMNDTDNRTNPSFSGVGLLYK